MPHPCPFRGRIALLLAIIAFFFAASCTWDNKSGADDMGNFLKAGGDDMGNFLQGKLVDSAGKPFAGRGMAVSDVDTASFRSDTAGVFRIPARRRAWLRCTTDQGQFLWDSPPDSGDAGVWKIGRNLELMGWFVGAESVSIPGVGPARREGGLYVFDSVPPGRARLVFSTDSGTASIFVSVEKGLPKDDPRFDTLVVLPIIVLEDTLLRKASRLDSTVCDSPCRASYDRNPVNLRDTLAIPSKPIPVANPVAKDSLRIHLVDSSGFALAARRILVVTDNDSFEVTANAQGVIALKAAKRSWIRLESDPEEVGRLELASPDSGNLGILKLERMRPLRAWCATCSSVSILGVGDAVREGSVFRFAKVPVGSLSIRLEGGTSLASRILTLDARAYLGSRQRDSVVLPRAVAVDGQFRVVSPLDTVGCDQECLVHLRAYNVIDTLLGPYTDIDSLQPPVRVAESTCRPWSDASGIPWNQSVSYETLCDERDGRTYRTVAIGRQTWMAQSLDYAGKTDSVIGNCNSADSAHCATYGRLYDWSTAMGVPPEFNSTHWPGDPERYRGICPAGWHLPSFADWDTLMTWVTQDAGSGNQAGALRSTSGWRVHESGVPKDGTDRYGFRVLPAGFNVGTFYNAPGNDCNFFGATEDEDDPTRAWNLDVSNLTLTGPGSGAKGVEFSVRCIKD